MARAPAVAARARAGMEHPASRRHDRIASKLNAEARPRRTDARLNGIRAVRL